MKKDQTDKQIFMEASTVAGCDELEERLIRLMVWVGTSLRSTMTHSKIQNELEIWRDGTAWCDQHVRVLAFFAWHLLAVPGRQLELTHADRVQGHTVAELNFYGAWHLFDCHTEHLAVYRDPNDGHIMSYLEIRHMPEVVSAQRHWWPMGRHDINKTGFYTKGSTHRCWPLP